MSYLRQEQLIQMVRVLFLFLTCCLVNVARRNSNPTWRAKNLRMRTMRSYFRRNVPFIQKVHVLYKTRLIFPRINGPIDCNPGPCKLGLQVIIRF